MTCPSLEEVVRGLRGRTLSFESLMYRCGWDGALRLVVAAAIKARLDGERGSIVCLRAKSLWMCEQHVFKTFCVPRNAAVEAVRRALRIAKEAGVAPFWSAPLRKRKTNCWRREDAERLVAVLLDGLTPARRRARRDMRRFVPDAGGGA